ncbi:MAG: lamin tail domain-containing protein [Proteobacteria bacterium]|nr:lamin tail domain-containing protein [Pseudomonadota bacterium]
MHRLLLFPLLTACGGGVTLDDTSSTTTTTDDTGTPGTFPSAPEVVINEFMASNASTIADSSGAYPDWIELYNPGAEAVDMDGWTLTDDLEELDRYTFPESTSIDAGGYLLVWADGDEDQEGLHTAWNLDKNGEQIGLAASSEYGGVLVDAIEYESQATDISMARMPDGSTTWEADTTPTPRATNE